MDDMQALFKVTRIEVIDATGRAFVAYYRTSGVSISMQDDDRTMKIFAGEPEVRHNHITRDIKQAGVCPSCDAYHENHRTT